MVYDEPGYFLILALKQTLKAIDELPAQIPSKESSRIAISLKSFANEIIEHIACLIINSGIATATGSCWWNGYKTATRFIGEK